MLRSAKSNKESNIFAIVNRIPSKLNYMIMNKSCCICFKAIVIAGILAFASCSDKPQLEPEPSPDFVTSYTLTFKSLEILEFKQISSQQIVEDIPMADVNLYFGNRIQLVRPNELLFKNDSLTIVRENAPIEKYKVEWRDDALFMYNEYVDKWEYCGVKAKDDAFLLNTGFFIERRVSQQRSLTVVGQEYFLKSYTDMVSNRAEQGESQPMIWLRVQYLFHKSNL